jgi:Pyruvate/2-oxoacid:ferredoxin oxidoreductase gamma subunit
MKRYEIHAVGLGGMGVIQLSKLITRTVVYYQNRLAVQTEAYSASARGGKCWADVVVELDVKKGDVKETGWVLWDSSIISKFNAAAKMPALAIPAQEMAIKEHGEAVIGSSILFGAFCSLSGILKVDAARKTLAVSVPRKSIDANMNAFETGWMLGEKRKSEPRIAEKPERPEKAKKVDKPEREKK